MRGRKGRKTHLRNRTQKRQKRIDIGLAPVLRRGMVDGVEDAAEEEGRGVGEDDGDEG